MDLGPHASFIVAAYAIAILVVVALVGWVMIDHRRQRATLRDLELAGMQRRSARRTSTSS